MPQTETDTTMINQVGTVIGHYKLREKIGEGGMGEVWVAKQSEPVKRRVALKLIKTGMDSKSVLARFEQERQALAMMDHPNIARVLDGGLTPAGQPFFVMELVNGLPLDQFCDGAKLPLTQRLELFVPICQAVQHAHQKGIVHRDLKPANILVTMIDGKPVPKIIDFGLAKAFAGGGLTEETMTQFGAVLGTLAYMSPEQASFAGDDVDTRADIYSLGVILYELLTGLRPIDHKRLQNAALNEMVRIIQEEEPSKPSTRLSTDQGLPSAAALRQTEPSKLMNLLRGELDWVVMKCLEKERDRRYETANGLGRDIQRFLSDQPVEARPASTSYRLKKLLKRNKGPVIAASLLLVSLLAGITGTTWAMIEANRQAVRAQDEANAKAEALQDAERQRELAVEAKEKETAARKDAEQQTELAIAAKRDAEQISEFLKNVFESPDPNQYGRWIKVVDLLDTSAIKLEKGLANQPAERFKLQGVLGGTYYSLGLYDKAIPLQEEVRDYYLEKFGKEHPETLTAAFELANSYRKDGRYDDAVQLNEQLFTLRKNLLGPDHKDTLVAERDLAFSYWSGGRRKEALAMTEAVLPRIKEKFGEKDPESLTAILALSYYYSDFGRYDQAIVMSKQVLEIRRKALRDNHPNTLWAMGGLARSYQEAGRYDEAIKLQKQVLELSRKVLGPEHPNTLGAMGNLAFSHSEAGRYDEAIAMSKQVLEIRREALGDEHPDTLGAMHILAAAQTRAGRYGEAIKLQKQVVELRQKLLGPVHPGTLWAINNLAMSYQGAGRYDNAIELQEECLKLRRKVLGDEHPSTLTAINNLATSHYRAGRFDLAIKLLEECLKLRRKVLGVEHPETLYVMSNLANSYGKAGRLKEAIRSNEKCLELQLKELGEKHPNTLNTLHNLAQYYQKSGRLEEAIELQEKCLNLRRKVNGPDHPDTLRALGNLAGSYFGAGRREKAIRMTEECLRLKRMLLGNKHHETLVSVLSLAWMFKRVGRIEDAIELEEECLRLRRKILGDDHPDTLMTMNYLANSYHGAGRIKDAIKLFDEQLEIAPNDPDLLNGAAWVLATNLDKDGTYPHAERAVELARKACELSPDNGAWENTLGVACYRNEQWQDAIEALTKSTQHGFDIAHNWLFIAMAHWKLDNKDEAKKWYDKALTWKKENPDELKADPELQSFFAEAAELMGDNDSKTKSDAANSGTDSDIKAKSDDADSDDKAKSDESIKK